MKENIKKMIVGSFIFYCAIIVILMLFNYSNAIVEIELSDSVENIETLNNYKNQVQLLEQNKCTNIISELIDYYEKTSYDGMVNVKEMYDFASENVFLSFFSKIKEKCSLSDEDMDKYNLPVKFISYQMPQEHLYQKNMFQYELGLNDILMRNIAEPSLIGTEYNISKKIQLEIIDNLIEIYNEREISYE